MTHMHEDSVGYELDLIEMLEDIKIEFMNIPRSIGGVKCLLNGDGIITLDIKSSPREKLKNALYGSVLLSPENYDYAFRSSFIDMGKKSKINDLVEKIISEPSSPVADEMEYMIKKAEIEYVIRIGGNFRWH